VAGGVDDVDDGDGTVLVDLMYCGVLRENGDALLAFEVAGVHNAIDQLGALLERAGLTKHGVDEGGLAVVDVCDDGNVTEAGDGHAMALLAELIRPRESQVARLFWWPLHECVIRIRARIA